MSATRLPLNSLTPEDQRTRKQWARWVFGIYTVIAFGLFCAAYAVPSSDERSLTTQIPDSHLAQLH
jgi:hypothetical protein